MHNISNCDNSSEKSCIIQNTKQNKNEKTEKADL